MHKRILCMLLTLVLLVSLIPVFALPSQAASSLKTSEAAISVLKRLEGFIQYPVYDYGHYSVGYGSACEQNEYPNGITVEQADALLREYLVVVERALNNFADRYDLILSQNQFDSLVLFTYNCGPNWVNSDGEFRKAVIENKTGNSYIYAATLWSNAGNQLNMGLLDRRMAEAEIYLNANYSNDPPSNYTYVVYDKNGGVTEARAQGYNCDLPACVKALPTRVGHVFQGWYSALEGGTWITELTEANAEQTLYAHWQAADVKANVGTPASYPISADALASLEIFDAPGGEKIGNLSQNAVVTILAEYVDASGMKWGRFQADQWLKLGDPRKGTFDEAAADAETGVRVTVTGDYVNVRIGPGTKYQAVSGVVRGNVLMITEVVDVNGVLWGNFRGGWICLQYTNYSGGLTPGEPEEEPEAPQPEDGEPVATGTVTADALNIRSAAGTHGKILGGYGRGKKVEILEKATVSGTPWGRTDKGWICLTYVKLDPEKPQQTTPPTVPETTEPETTEPDTTVPDTTEPSDTPEESGDGVTGTIISPSGLNIRKGPGTNYAIAGVYRTAEKIQLLERKTVNGIVWGRTDKGWVSMTYVRLEEAWTDAYGVYGVVTSAGLNVRKGPGVGYASVGGYRFGQQIVILEQTIAAGQHWGRTDMGWVCMDYVKLGDSVTKPEQPETTEPEISEPGTTPPETTEPDTEEKPSDLTGIVVAGGLNVRKTPGTKGEVVGGYVKGSQVTILEETVVNGTSWGRTDKGWISLAYVKLDRAPDIGENGNMFTVTADVLCIRKGPGTGNAVVGTYTYGAKVTILETTKVGTSFWGRTDQGWICMDYVK